MASLETNIQQVSADISSIKDAIINNGVEVADGTPTSEYGKLIESIRITRAKAIIENNILYVLEETE